MQRAHFGPWTVHYDPEATRAAYAAVRDMNAPECSCRDCRNYRVARERGRAYPVPFLALLGWFGIDPAYPAEVYNTGHRGTSGTWRYAGWFHFIGAVEVDAADTERRWIDRAAGIFYDGAFLTWPAHDSDCTCYFGRGTALARPPLRGSPLVPVEFSVTLPWLLHEPPDNP